VTAHLRETNIPLRRQILKAIGLIMNKNYVKEKQSPNGDEKALILKARSDMDG